MGEGKNHSLFHITENMYRFGLETYGGRGSNLRRSILFCQIFAYDESGYKIELVVAFQSAHLRFRLYQDDMMANGSDNITLSALVPLALIQRWLL